MTPALVEAVKAAISDVLRGPIKVTARGWEIPVIEGLDKAAQAAIAAVRAHDARQGMKLVPLIPTHAMERAYFQAPMPEFKVKATTKMRHVKNHEKMFARWSAMWHAARQAGGG
jgi:hypothetical protein